MTVRESRDSAEHPESLAIAVLFDVTGSMRAVPRALQAKLPQLPGLLVRKGYATDPQRKLSRSSNPAATGPPTVPKSGSPMTSSSRWPMPAGGDLRFAMVVFAVRDRLPGTPVHAAFARALGP